MGRIHKLSDELANQIAAGEVVERPASVVKELVENALDAGATRITIEVEHGGSALVRVTDDGEGMSREDAVLAFERHATSKIRRVEDLSVIGTFGFRGEALPSIASVSRLLLRTRARGASEGVEIAIDGGAPAEVRPAGGAVGTTLEVRDLFFNVPARRKFLKATATESARVGEVVLGVALARPDVTFVLSRDGRVVREHLRVGSRSERAALAVSGEQLVACAGERGPVRIEAMLAAPERARAGAMALSILVNGRPVRDRQLARAVAQAYGSVLEQGRYPVGVVWVDVPPEQVDVNVHPQKAEVRFADARAVFDAVTRELFAGLSRAFGLSTPYTPSRAAFPARSMEGLSARDPRSAPAPLPSANLFTREPVSAESAATAGAPAVDPALASLFGERGFYASLRFVGQVRGTFLLCEADDALVILDQHAAAERVTFDRLRRAHAERAVRAQALLVPEIVTLTSGEVALVDEHAEEIARLGVDARAVGDAAVAVHSVPALLARKDPARLLRDVLAEVSRAAGRPFGGAVDLVLATMACHGSIRAGDAVSREEAEALLRALDEVDFAGHCPHGRPLVMRLPWNELERRVGR